MTLGREQTRGREQGSTILMVTWLLSLMGIIALFLLYRSSVEWAAVNSLSRRWGFEETANAVLHECMLSLNTDKTDYDDKSDEWYHNGRLNEDQDRYKITVIIEDEGSKPNINYIRKYENLSPLLSSDLPYGPLKDWIDSDDIPEKDTGAESSYYQGLNPPYKARNGFISSLEELKEIKNGAKLYEALAPEFTVYGKANPNVIGADTFKELIYSNGFDQFFVEKASEEFKNNNRHFDTINDFLQLKSVSPLTIDRLRPLFRFDGACNLNLISEKGLKFITQEAGYNEEVADK